MTYISLEEEAALAVEGARHRLELARQALDAFCSDQEDPPDPMFTSEHHALLIELDSARRHFLKSVADLVETRRGQDGC